MYGFLEEGFQHLKDLPVCADYKHITLNRDCSNLLASESTFREGTCPECNIRAGFYDFDNFPRSPRKLSMTTYTNSVVGAKDCLLFRIIREESATWGVTADVLVLHNRRYALRSWIEHISVDGKKGGHYVAYKREGEITFRISDDSVVEVNHGLISNSNVVFAVFEYSPRETFSELLAEVHVIQDQNSTPLQYKVKDDVEMQDEAKITS